MTTSRRARLITLPFFGVMLANFSYFLAVGVLQPVFPRYVKGPLGGDNLDVGIAVGIFSFAAVLIRPPAGRFADLRGRRVPVVGGAIVLAASFASLTFVETLPSVMLLRVAAGIGEAFFYVGAASIVNDLAPDHRRAEAVSYFTLSLFVALAVGPAIGEAVHRAGGYHAAWIAAAGFAGAASLVGVRLPETRPPAGDAPPGPARIVHRAGLRPGLVLLTSVWGLASFNAFVPLYVLELGLTGSAPVFATYSGVVLAIRSMGARLPDKIGPRRVAGGSLVATVSGLTVLALWGEPVGLFVGASMFAVGQAFAFPALMTIAVARAAAHERASVVGTFTAFFDLAFGVGALTSGAVASAFGYRGSFGVSGLIAFGGLSILVAGARRRRIRARRAG